VAAGAYYVLRIDMPSGEFEKRFPVWFAGIRYLSGTHPVFGVGLGGWAQTRFTTMQDNGEPQTWTWAHNTFIQYLFELGILGAVTLYAYFKDLFCQIDVHNKNHIKALSILIPLLITSAIHFPWHLGRFAGLCCFMVASVHALLIEKEYE
jgi:O-antigen ligase